MVRNSIDHSLNKRYSLFMLILLVIPSITICLTVLVFYIFITDIQSHSPSFLNSIIEDIPPGPPNGFHPDNLFVYSNVVDEPVDTVWNSTFSEIIGGYGDEPCVLSEEFLKKTELMRKQLQWWASFAAKERIPWMLTYGSLLGYVRDKDMIPDDHDVDIYVPSWIYDKLKPYVAPQPNFNVANLPIIFFHPEYRKALIEDYHYLYCNGERVVLETKDFCTCWHMGKVGGPNQEDGYIDIWPLDHDPVLNITMATDWWINVSKNPNYWFPLRPCTFMGVRSFCPNDPVSLVRWKFGHTAVSDLLPHRLCHNGSTVYAGENPTVHKKWNEKWEKRVGGEIVNEKFNNIGDIEKMTNRKMCKKYYPHITDGFCYMRGISGWLPW